MPNLRISFSDNTALWFLAPSSQPVNLYPSNGGYYKHIHIDPDGGSVVFHIGFDINNSIPINSINSDGTNFRVLIPAERISRLEANQYDWKTYLDENSLQWIPDTRRMMFSTMTFTGSRWLNDANVFILDTDTGYYFRLFDREKVFKPSLSPDGKYLAAANFGATPVEDFFSIFSMSGSVVYGNGIALHGVYYHSYVERKGTWTPDSKKVGVIDPDNEYNIYSGMRQLVPIRADIWVMDSQSGDAAHVRTIPNYGYGALSPNLDWIGYTILGDEFSSDVTVVSRLTDSTSIQLGTGPSGFISFAPDGLHFAYYLGCLPGITAPCQGHTPKIYIGSREGDYIRMFSSDNINLLRWINNFQYVYAEGNSLYLGDVGGNSTLLATAENPILAFDAKDLDFQGWIG
jgi:hypothetical protein